MRHKKKIVIACVVLFLIYALTTGGVSISNARNFNFNGQSSIHLTNGLESDLYLAPHYSRWSIPFVCHYSGSSVPHGLRLQIWDSSNTYVSIRIDEIRIYYANGESKHYPHGWNWELQPSSSAGLIETKAMVLSNTIDDLVDRHMDVTITIIGHLVNNDEKEIEFFVTKEFMATTKFDISTYWVSLQ